jgi:hypothetical protein
MSIRFAQVVHYYPNYGVAEVVMMDNGQRFQNVTVLNQFISNNTGVRMHHAVLRPASEEEAGGMQFDEDMRTVMAACVMTAGKPMIIGFLAHPMTQLHFLREEPNRDLYRHPAGNIDTTQMHGNREIHHTGGAFIKIGKDIVNGAGVEVPADMHEDITPLCANENWVYPLNDPVTITIVTGDQEENAVKIRIRPNGDVDWMGSGYLHIRHAKDLHVDIGESAEIHIIDFSTHTAGGDIKIRTPASVTVTAGGDAHVLAMGDGNMVSAGPMLLGSAEKVTIEAPLVEIVTDRLDITAGETGISGTLGVSGTIGAEGGIQASEVTAGIVAGVSVMSSTPMLAPDYEEDLPIIVPEPFGGFGEADGGGVAEELALAEKEMGAAEEDLSEAAQSIEEAVNEAVETSLEAVGTGDPDNEGEDGDPAPDVP